VHFKLAHNDLMLINSPTYNFDLSQKTSEMAERDEIPLKAYGYSIQTIYGQKVLNQMEMLTFQDNNLEVSGFIARPDLNRSDKYASSVFVNHRLIKNKRIMSILSEAYKGYLMRHRYPFFVLFFQFPPDQIDVNVHPSKKVIKFVKEEEIFQGFEHFLKKFIISRFKSENYIAPSNSEQIELSITPKSTPDSALPNEDELAPHTLVNSSPDNTDMRIEKPPERSKKRSGSSSILKPNYNPQQKLQKMPSKPMSTQTHFRIPTYAKNAQRLSDSPISSTQDPVAHKNYLLDRSSISVKNLPALKLLNNGIQAGNLYLIFQNKEGLILIDQHAAHERINLEKITEQYDNEENSVQKLLIPLNFEVAPNESEFLKENLLELKKLGFGIIYFGGTTFLLQSVPAILSQRDLNNSIIIDICLDIIHMGKERSFSQIKDEMIQYMACHKSIRGGDEIWDQRTIEKLIKDLDSCKNPSHCAHGRPTYIKIDFTELEKRFHRIV
jgi:DNA mismatch repair protein MutL